MTDATDGSADADESDGPVPTRRTLLKASSGALALPVVGAGNAGATDADGSGDGGLLDDLPIDDPCPDATPEPSTGHCEGATMEGCADDHPATIELQEAVRESLETRYPTAGTLIDAGYKPYFDTLEHGDDSWSHWINPEFLGDATVLNPERPESVLVDNQSWRSIGAMFIATENGEAIEPPPPVYEGDEAVWREQNSGEYSADGGQSSGDAETGDAETGDDSHEHQSDRCSPWHYHAGLPGRAAWWYYQQVYGQEYEDGDLSIPCRTPCVLHVWSVDHPESVYAHDAPPEEYRDREPADEPGFETDAEPGTDELDWDAMPDGLVAERPDEGTLLEFRR
ncbi:hypothetical protein [Halopiger xanaduensis]|uniref:Uncharacterized protein n=1 Tax=Halopiger xanaduensis (strain DSM 18323 / JCM 14033 / SH-6) TaxID=797210 RepID=F8D7J2_HALXS|nr:hypothetical protein [Halopiger xanaduensis]AEH36292.1 hypothetical protein Halxa_1660 [Halopiger xanaduensis SH-6]